MTTNEQKPTPKKVVAKKPTPNPKRGASSKPVAKKPYSNQYGSWDGVKFKKRKQVT